MRPPHQRLGAVDEKARERLEVLDLERESAERIAGERIESGRDQHEIRDESGRRGVDRARGARRRRRPARRPARIGTFQTLPCGPRSSAAPVPGIPRPLVHRHEMNVRLVLDERLRSVAVVHVPIDDEHALGAVAPPRVVRAERDVAEETEAHRRVAQRVMARRPHGAEASPRSVAEREVDRRRAPRPPPRWRRPTSLRSRRCRRRAARRRRRRSLARRSTYSASWTSASSSGVAWRDSTCWMRAKSSGSSRSACGMARSRPTCSGCPQPVSWRPQSEFEMYAIVIEVLAGGATPIRSIADIIMSAM